MDLQRGDLVSVTMPPDTNGDRASHLFIVADAVHDGRGAQRLTVIKDPFDD